MSDPALSFMAYQTPGQNRDKLFSFESQANDETNGDFYARYFTNNEQAVIAIRGTDNDSELFNVSFVANLGLVAPQGLKDQLVAGYAYYKDVADDTQVGSREISFTGYSLGGALASVLAIITQTSASAFHSIASRPLLEWAVKDLVDNDTSSVFADSGMADTFEYDLAQARLGGPISSEDLTELVDLILESSPTTLNYRVDNEIAGRFTLNSARISEDVILNPSSNYIWGDHWSSDFSDNFISNFLARDIVLHHQSLVTYLWALDINGNSAAVQSFIPQLMNKTISIAAGWTDGGGKPNMAFMNKLVEDGLKRESTESNPYTHADVLSQAADTIAAIHPESELRDDTDLEVALSTIAVANVAFRLQNELEPTPVLMSDGNYVALNLSNDLWKDGANYMGLTMPGLEELYDHIEGELPSSGAVKELYEAMLNEAAILSSNVRRADALLLPKVQAGTASTDTMYMPINGYYIALGTEGDNTIEALPMNGFVIGRAGDDEVTFDYNMAARSALFEVENVVGTIFSDELIGHNSETINGADGNDTLYSSAANYLKDRYGATASGSSSAATMIGGAHNDFIDAGASGSTIQGDGGADVVSFKRAGSGLTINLNSQTATNYTMSGIEGVLTPDAGATTTLAPLSFLGGGTGVDAVSYAGGSMSNAPIVVLGGGADTLTITNTDGNMTLIYLLDPSAADTIKIADFGNKSLQEIISSSGGYHDTNPNVDFWVSPDAPGDSYEIALTQYPNHLGEGKPLYRLSIDYGDDGGSGDVFIDMPQFHDGDLGLDTSEVDEYSIPTNDRAAVYQNFTQVSLQPWQWDMLLAA